MLSRDPARTRPPTDRPLDVVGLELLLCISQALLTGLLLTLAVELGGDARAVGLPVPGLLALLGLGVGAGWLWWLVGGSGWPLAAVDLAVALLAGALWLLSLQDPTAPHIDPLVGLLAVSGAVYGIVAGVFLPGPRRSHWKGGVSQPKRGLPDTRPTAARFTPPVQRVVDERLSSAALSRLTMSVTAVRLPRVQLPARGASSVSADDLLMAPALVPRPTATSDPAATAAPGAAAAVSADVAAPADVDPDVEATALVGRIGTRARIVAPPLDDADDDTVPFGPGDAAHDGDDPAETDPDDSRPIAAS